MTLRKSLIAAALMTLAACQTVPHQAAPFSAKQVAALTEAGFKPAGENYELGLNERVLFAVDKADLNPDAHAAVDRVATVLESVGIHGAGVEGHTDSTGTHGYNQALSERRAMAVKAELVQAGMTEAQIRAVGKGETQPIASNDTDEGRAQNRRVVIVVTPGDAR